MSSKFDADELRLTKSDIIRIIEAVQTRWRKNKRGNRLNLAAIAAFKQGIAWTPEKQLTIIWNAMVKLTNKMIEYNSMKRMMGEMPKTEHLLKILEDEIESGKFVE